MCDHPLHRHIVMCAGVTPPSPGVFQVNPIYIYIHIYICIHRYIDTSTHSSICVRLFPTRQIVICVWLVIVYPRETPPHTRSTGTAPSGTLPPAQSPPPPQTWGTSSTARQPHSNGLCSPPWLPPFVASFRCGGMTGALRTTRGFARWDIHCLYS